MKKSVISGLIIIITIIAGLVLLSRSLYSYPGGITGRTKKTSTEGCANCHMLNNSISGTIRGPSSVEPGQSYVYTLSITGTGDDNGGEGVDIAAKFGNLNIGASNNILILMNGELTHISPIPFSDPNNIPFGYTAPEAGSTDTIYANVDRDFPGAWNYAPNFPISISRSSGIINNSTPVNFGLGQNFPNPFNPDTRIIYNIDKKGLVTLKIYDILGRKIATLVNEVLEPGSYYVNFNSENISNGVYYYILQLNNRMDVKQMIVVK